MDIRNIENRPPPEPQEVEIQNSEEVAEEQQTQQPQETVTENHNIDVFA